MCLVHRQSSSAILPETGGIYNWHVWNAHDAAQVLRRREFESSERAYLVGFANGTYADIEPDHSLWQVLTEIAQNHCIEVFRLFPGAGYVAWDGSAVSLRQFDTIKIEKPPTDPTTFASAGRRRRQPPTQ